MKPEDVQAMADFGFYNKAPISAFTLLSVLEPETIRLLNEFELLLMGCRICGVPEEAIKQALTDGLTPKEALEWLKREAERGEQRAQGGEDTHV